MSADKCFPKRIFYIFYIEFRWFDIDSRLGRANALRIGALPITISWILISVADNVVYLYVARFMCGCTFGLCLSVMPMYLGEIASPPIRGGLTIALTLMSKIGLMVSYSVGPFVAFRTLAYMCVVPPLVFLGATVWLPETPYYLLGANRWDKARQSLVKLRGTDGNDDIESELQTMYAAVQRSQANRSTFVDLWHTYGHRRALYIILALGSIQVLCGSQAILSYSQTIFGKMDVGLQSSHLSIILAAVQLVSVTVCTLIVDRVGRRPLLLFSIWGTTVCNCAVTLYFLLERLEVDTKPWSWMSTTAMMSFIVCYSIGLPSVNLAVLGEIFPTNLKAVASLVYTLTTALLAFAINKLFSVVSDRAGYDVAFGAFAVFGLLYSVGMWFLIPETKGKRFEVILEELEMRRRKKETVRKITDM